MSVGKTVITVARKRVLIFKGGVFTIEPSLVPVFRVTVQLSMRKFNFFPFLNGDAAKFSVGTVYECSMPVQMKEVSEQLNCWLFLSVHFTEDLEVAYIGYRVGSNILRMELEIGKHIP